MDGLQISVFDIISTPIQLQSLQFLLLRFCQHFRGRTISVKHSKNAFHFVVSCPTKSHLCSQYIHLGLIKVCVYDSLGPTVQIQIFHAITQNCTTTSAMGSWMDEENLPLFWYEASRFGCNDLISDRTTVSNIVVVFKVWPYKTLFTIYQD